MRLDGERHFMLDTAVLPLALDIVESPPTYLFLLPALELAIHKLRISAAELQIYRRALPTPAERCQSYTLGPT